MRLSSPVIICLPLTAIYSVVVITYGSIQMSYNQYNLQASADKLATDQDAHANADMLYQHSLANLQYAQYKYNSTQCFLNSSDGFMSSLKQYCQPANASVGSLEILQNKYSVNFSYVADKFDHESRQASKRVCRPEPVLRCTSGETGTRCRTVNEIRCRNEYYTVTKSITRLYGHMLVGGSNELIGCGMYDYGIITNSQIYLKTVSPVTVHSETSESQMHTYSSHNMITTYINGVANNTQIEHDRLSNATEVTASKILTNIWAKCNTVLNSFQPKAYYMALANESLAQFPALMQNVSIHWLDLEIAAANRNTSQAKYNAAYDAYNTSLSIWLPVIIVPTVVSVLFMLVFECMSRQQQCGNIESQEIHPCASLTFCFARNKSPSDDINDPARDTCNTHTDNNPAHALTYT